MKRVELKSELFIYDEPSHLPAGDLRLLEKAREAAASAYSPYSHFSVGAAVLLDNGKVVTGNNQEKGAYPSGLWAERVAAFAASSQFPGVAFKAIAITCRSAKGPLKEPVTPCGACRQVLMEYESRFKKNIRIILASEEGKVFLFESMDTLLPLAFTSRLL